MSVSVVPHRKIRQALAKFGYINEEINYLKSCLLLSKDDLKQRKYVCDSIREIVKELKSDYEVHLFGSSVSGLGFMWSDLDAFVELPNAQLCNDEIMKDIYKKFAYIQNKRLQQFGELEAVFNARTPILKFVHIDSGLKCDLSFSNRMAWMNSKFIKKCLEMDSRILLTMIVIKYWAMYHQLSGSDGNRKNVISNYAVNLLVIFYFQSIQILPSVKKLQKEMIEEESILIATKDGKMIETGFPENISVWDKCCLRKKHKSIPEILHGFFRFYANFKYDDLVVSPNSGVPKLRNFEHSENVLFVEDPFDTDFNVTRTYISNAWKNCCKASFQVTIRWFNPQFKPRLLDILGTPVWSYLPYSIPYTPPQMFFTHPMLSQFFPNPFFLNQDINFSSYHNNFYSKTQRSGSIESETRVQDETRLKKLSVP